MDRSSSRVWMSLGVTLVVAGTTCSRSRPAASGYAVELTAAEILDSLGISSWAETTDPTPDPLVNAALQCDSAVAGYLRGVLWGQYSHGPGAPTERVLRNAAILLDMAPADQSIHPDIRTRQMRTGEYGQYFFWRVPAGHFQIAVQHPDIDRPDGYFAYGTMEVALAERGCRTRENTPPVPLRTP